MGKDICAFEEEESSAPSPCTSRERFVGKIALHLRWKNFKKLDPSLQFQIDEFREGLPI